MKAIFSNKFRKAFELDITNLDPLSVYEVSMEYRSADNFKAMVFLTLRNGRPISQYDRRISLKKGRHKDKVNLITDPYLDINNKSILLHIISHESRGFTLGNSLSDAVISQERINENLKFFSDRIDIKKKFDIRVHLSRSEYENLDVKGDIDKIDPIILEGYYLREDGIGAHLPNLVENVFYDRKNIAFSKQANRHRLHFSFFNRLSSFSNRELENYKRDLKWVRFYYSRENLFARNPDIYRNARYIHVGGFDIDDKSIYNDIRTIMAMKKKLNLETYMYLMWESTGIEKIAELIDVFDNIIVTNKWLKDLITKKTGHPRVHKVTHIAKYYLDEDIDDYSSDTFNFGYSGGLWKRKGVKHLIKNFNKVKGHNDVLNIHSREFANSPDLVKEIEKMIKKDPDGIILQNKTLPDKDYANWWGNLNCYAFLSSGESFSITPRQALLNGIPVILSKNTAHLDLIGVPGILWVDCIEQSGAIFSGQPDAKLNTGYEFIVKEEDVVKQMKEVKKNYKHWKKKARKGREVIKKEIDNDRIKKEWETILNK